MVLIAGAIAPLGSAQAINMNAPATPKSYVLYAAEPQAVAANKQCVLELRFQVMPGFHINSHTPKSKFLIPTALSLQPATGVKPGQPAFPAGQLYSFAFDPTDKLDVYAGSFTVKLPVVAAAGEHTIDATLKYQACDNASCYPPKTLPVKILFTAK
jgi:DsbC/DsbD-like thiol-disulfide interchange protein